MPTLELLGFGFRPAAPSKAYGVWGFGTEKIKDPYSMLEEQMPLWVPHPEEVPLRQQSRPRTADQYVTHIVLLPH